MSPPLPRWFLTRPLAHRALHDKSDGRPENSREAVAAALAAGYGIEIDLQLTRDGEALVFHDYDLGRLTGASGTVQDRTAAEMADLPLIGGPTGAPRLAEVLEMVDGRTPLLIELKDQDGALGPNVGRLERRVAELLDGYGGEVALMSFNPHTVKILSGLVPDRPWGLVTEDFPEEDWPGVPRATRERLREIPDFEPLNAGFISHDAADLDRPRVAAIRAAGFPVLTWTIRSPEAEARARAFADNITFERYLPDLPLA